MQLQDCKKYMITLRRNRKIKKNTQLPYDPMPAPLLSSTYYIQQVKKSLKNISSTKLNDILAMSHLFQHFTHYNTFKQESIISQQITAQNRRTKKIICFDLDETLVHTNSSIIDPDHSFEIYYQGKTMQIKLSIRPHALEVIRRLAQHFQLVIFTASIQDYAKKVATYLDSQGKYFSRIYNRQNCQLIKGKYVKDLSIVDSDLNSVLLVDNSYISYILQVNNGVPILPFYNNNPQDNQLLHLEKFLMNLKEETRLQKRIHDYFEPQWLYFGGWVKDIMTKKEVSIP